MTTNKFVMKWFSIALLSLGMSSGAYASSSNATQCPSSDFAEFVKAFSSEPEIQKAFIAPPVKHVYVTVDGKIPKVVERSLNAIDADELKVLLPENAASLNLKIEIELPNRVIIRDEKGHFLKIFVFKHDNCWALTRVEDWTLDAVMEEITQSEKMTPGELELKKGVIFDRLVNKASPESGIYLYAAVLDSYLDGARKGSAQAAVAAAGISLSGMAPRLDNEEILSLLIQAYNSIPDVAVALALFYCDEGDYEVKRACINPQKSIATLEGAAKRGSTRVLIRLGEIYEGDTVVPSDLPRALACYREAQKTMPQAVTRQFDRLVARGISDNSIQCIKAGSL
ncbi:sel1 repeat family protein [Pseudomonas sp. TH43]|uniref:sel1 repeat family protein n=1 Tax=Pseudomonas sp. TH43 TaxID=2796407 RepID=UPI00191167B4|nr:sel1 repeat family protein [Pseudomonas sp. TH43]MBK5377528.1 sel1 repeat family protein [Pseudomonas sp. TH43]